MERFAGEMRNLRPPFASLFWGGNCAILFSCHASLSAIASITFTVTAFPKDLYLWLSPSVHPSGKPWRRSHSVGVRRRIREPFKVYCCIPVSKVWAIPFPTLPLRVLELGMERFMLSPSLAISKPFFVLAGTNNKCSFPCTAVTILSLRGTNIFPRRGDQSFPFLIISRLTCFDSSVLDSVSADTPAPAIRFEDVPSGTKT